MSKFGSEYFFQVLLISFVTGTLLSIANMICRAYCAAHSEKLSWSVGFPYLPENEYPKTGNTSSHAEIRMNSFSKFSA